MNIAFAWGWTGWHVFPIKSLIEHIDNTWERKNFNNIFWIWSDDSLEQKIASQMQNVQFLPISSWKLRREISTEAVIENTIDIFRFLKWFFQSIFLIRKYDIDFLFCKWGYVALPAVLAAKLLGKKIFVHETDSVAGLTNKIANIFSTKSFTSFPWALNGQKVIVSGPIISDEFFESSSLELKNDLKKTNVFVTAGSQGSKTIFSALEKIINSWKFDNLNFFFTLWTENLEFKNIFTKPNCQVFDFLSQKDMAYMMRICDLGITRWGWSCFELKAFWIKLAIIPLPYTGGNHQYYNALYFKEKYWDNILDQKENLEAQIENFLSKNINYKKSWYDDALWEYILRPKNIILKTILGYKDN